MSSDITIEMSPVISRTGRSGGRPSLHVDIERASRPRSRRNSHDEKDLLHIAGETNQDHPPSKPLLPTTPPPPADHVDAARGTSTGGGGGGAHLAPLLETDAQGQKPPLAGPEIDDLDSPAALPADAMPYPGVDDGLLEPIPADGTHPLIPPGDEVESNTDKHSQDEKGHGEHGNGGHHINDEDDDGKLMGELAHDEVDYYGDLMTPHGFANRFGEDRPISPVGDPRVIPDVNVYQQKKNLAQGMMDLALLSANANQLRYVIESATNHPYYWPSLFFISVSIIFQILVGIGLIWNSTYNVKNEDDICKADKINNLTVIGIFLVTIVNVFITAFSVAQNPSMPR